MHFILQIVSFICWFLVVTASGGEAPWPPNQREALPITHLGAMPLDPKTSTLAMNSASPIQFPGSAPETLFFLYIYTPYEACPISVYYVLHTLAVGSIKTTVLEQLSIAYHTVVLFIYSTSKERYYNISASVTHLYWERCAAELRTIQNNRACYNRRSAAETGTLDSVLPRWIRKTTVSIL